MGGTVRIYKSSDASAPTLSGTAGDLINLLDKVLVDGYGALAGAGWSKPYANSGNKGCWRMATTSNTGYYFTVDDSAPGTNGAREARVCGWRTLTSLTAGTYPFPVRAQMNIAGPSADAGSVVWRKSTTANATTRPWVMVADNCCFYLFIDAGDVTAPPVFFPFMFGDIFSYASSDPHRCLLIGGTAEDATYPFANMLNFTAMPQGYALLKKGVPGHFMASRETGVSNSLWVGKHWFAPHFTTNMYTGAAEAPDATWPTSNRRTFDSNVAHSSMGAGYAAAGAFPFPHGPDGNAMVSPVWVHHDGAIRGYMKGLWVPLHDRAFAHGDTISGTGALAGKTLECMGIVGAQWNSTIGPSYSLGNCLVETSNTWS